MSDDVFITVAQLHPGSRNVNLRVKVADVRVEGRAVTGGNRAAVALVGDATGVVGMLVTDDQLAAMVPGCPVVLRGAHVVVGRRTMRLRVDPQWGLLQPLSKDDPLAPQLRLDRIHDLGHVEYQLV